MTLTVSISDLRNNIADYLEQVEKGVHLYIRDSKRGKTIAQVTRAQNFDRDAFEKSLREAAGVFTAKNHPEWRTKKDVVRWLRKTRSANDRKF